jgi:hypothetical protein
MFFTDRQQTVTPLNKFSSAKTFPVPQFQEEIQNAKRWLGTLNFTRDKSVGVGWCERSERGV